MRRSEVRAGVGGRDREAALAGDLAARRLEIARLLAALEAMSRTPPAPRALHPQGPLGAARAAAMIDAAGAGAAARRRAALAAQVARARARRATTRSRARRRWPAGLDAARRRRRPRSPRRWRGPSRTPGEPADPAMTMLARDSASLDRARGGAGRRAGAPRRRPRRPGRPRPSPGRWRATVVQPFQRARRGRGAPAGDRASARRRSRWSRAPADAARALCRAVSRIRLRRRAGARPGDDGGARRPRRGCRCGPATTVHAGRPSRPPRRKAARR